MIYLKAYIATATIFFLLDYVWLTRVAGSFYRDRIGSLMLDQPRLSVAAVFYIFYVVGIVVLAILPALRTDSVLTAMLLGALLGCMAYGTYDITNYATLRDWPVSIVLVDIAWGAALTGISAGVGYLAVRF